MYLERVTDVVLRSATTILLARLFSVFSLAMYVGAGWHFNLVYKFIPIVVFQAEPKDFSFINTRSIFFVSSLVFGVFLYVFFKHRQKDFIKVVGWYLAVLMVQLMNMMIFLLGDAYRFLADKLIGNFALIYSFVATFMFVYIVLKRAYSHVEELDK